MKKSKTSNRVFSNRLTNGLELFLFILLFLLSHSLFAQSNFSMGDIKSYPFPSGLCASANTDNIAWAFNENGLRNIYVAEVPDYKARKLTPYDKDDGQALTSIQLSSDGKWVVYIRGGDFGSNWDDELPVNPDFLNTPPKVQIWSIPFEGGQPIPLGKGLNPTISPNSDYIAFVRSHQIWRIKIDGSEQPEQLTKARGRNGSPVWSPDGEKLALVSDRNDHSLIGIFTNKETPLQWIDPSFERDYSPRWSPDGSKIAYIRRAGRGGTAKPILEEYHISWEIRVADIASNTSKRVWKAPETLRGSLPTTHGRTNLHWAARDRIVFLSYHDGSPHLYSISEKGGEPLLLTPGNYMAEYIHLSSDGEWLLFAGNTGNDPLDIDRRHIVRVPVDQANAEVATPGDGIEWTPVITGKSKDLVYISATPKRPPIPAVKKHNSTKQILIAENRIPENFPTEKLVIPKQVILKSEDGLDIHATLFAPFDLKGKNPGIIYLHGGPPRQMLLGWHYSSYYSNAYAMNQYLASKGFIVLAVNYRLGIGYGYEFHRPVDGGRRGASEYKDVRAAALWLAKQKNVDSKKIGIYGGSYGGYLTAMALGRNSDLFAAGVDISGVHDWTHRHSRPLPSTRYEQPPDKDEALRIAWESSPVSAVSTWKSPVLIIHGDDDRNVDFSQSTDLVQRLKEYGVPFESLVIIEDTHHFLKEKNQLRVNKATANFFIRILK